MKFTLLTIFFAMISSVVVAESGERIATERSCEKWAGQFQVRNNFIREPTPGRDVAAAYGIFRQDVAEELVLKSVSSNGFRAAEIHTMINADGVMKMRRIPKLIFSADAETVLQPGGKHFMLFGVTQETLDSKNAVIRLNFEGGVCFEMDFEVRRIR